MNECPVCGSSEYVRWYDPERQEPDEESCNFCGWHWQESGDHHTPSEKQIEDYRNDVTSNLLAILTAIHKAWLPEEAK